MEICSVDFCSAEKGLKVGGLNLPWSLCFSSHPWLKEGSGLLSSLPPQHMPASLGSAHWHCHIPSGSPSPAPPSWPSGCSSAGKLLIAFQSVANPLWSWLWSTQERARGDLLPHSIMTKAGMSFVHIISWRGICTKPGSGGSEQSREKSLMLI